MQATELKALGEVADGLTPVTLNAKTLTCESPEAVMNTVNDFRREFETAQGWLCFQQSLVTDLNALPPDEILLYGELSNGADSSLHIREDGNGGWLCTRFTETKTAADYLAEDIDLLAEKAFDIYPKLKYRLYWAHRDGWGYYQAVARFICIENPEELLPWQKPRELLS